LTGGGRRRCFTCAGEDQLADPEHCWGGFISRSPHACAAPPRGMQILVGTAPVDAASGGVGTGVLSGSPPTDASESPEPQLAWPTP
ncbi:unnamed protein product, partial [Symbiodinium sp. CCMP2456]